MALSLEQKQFAVEIDTHVKEIIAAGGDDEQLLMILDDHMHTFKHLLETTTALEMDSLCMTYP